MCVLFAKKTGFRKTHHRRLWRVRQISAVVGAHIRTEVFIHRELVIFKGSQGFSKEETHQHGYSNLLSPSSSLAFCINPSCSLDSWSLGRTSTSHHQLCFFELGLPVTRATCASLKSDRSLTKRSIHHWLASSSPPHRLLIHTNYLSCVFALCICDFVFSYSEFWALQQLPGKLLILIDCKPCQVLPSWESQLTCLYLWTHETLLYQHIF